MNVKYKTTDWVPLTEIPSQGSYVSMSERATVYWKKYTKGVYTGVYQVSLKKPAAVIHKDICYIGESDCLPKRLSDLRTAAVATNKTAHHMCGVFIREEGIDINDVYVRCLVTESDKHDLERWLQSEHKKQFGYKVGYAWEEASGGHKSCRIQTQMNIKRLNSLEACERIQKALNERVEQLKKQSR